VSDKEKLSVAKVILYLCFAWSLVGYSVYALVGYVNTWLADENIEFSYRRLEILNALPNEAKLFIWLAITVVVIWFAVFVSKGIYVRNRET
jgi:hypothetical protein